MKRLLITSFFTFGLVVFVLLLRLYWLTYPYKPVEFYGEKFEIVNKVASPGGTITYIEDVCKSMPVTVNRFFIDSIIFAVPYLKIDEREGCFREYVDVPVPLKLPTGIYYLQIDFTANPNPIRRMKVSHNTEEFMVDIPK